MNKSLLFFKVLVILGLGGFFLFHTPKAFAHTCTIIADNNSVTAGTTVTFDTARLQPGGVLPVEYTWDFKDGTIIGPNPVLPGDLSPGGAAVHQSHTYTVSSVGQPENAYHPTVTYKWSDGYTGFCYTKVAVDAVMTAKPGTFTIKGSVWLDDNKNGIKDGVETNYTGPIDIFVIIGIHDRSPASGYVTYGPGAGNFTIRDLLDVSDPVNIPDYPDHFDVYWYGPPPGPPAGYFRTEPPYCPVGCPWKPRFSGFTVGPSCSIDGSGSKNAKCDPASPTNIIDVDFGISNSSASWFQTKGQDMRIDAGFTDPIPSTGLPFPYASLNGAGGTPGIIFTGNQSSDFGFGSASDPFYNWVVGGSAVALQEVYQSKIIKTSYNYLFQTAQKSNITPTDIKDYCGPLKDILNCILSPMPHGLYIANGSLNLINPTPYTFPSNNNYVILVNGDLRIKQDISVPSGSTATFSTSGSINIEKNVTNIEGFYSSDKDFTVEGINDCGVGPDVQLKIPGGVVTNAALSSSPYKFLNQRDLCVGGNTSPSVLFSERLDFILNAPQLIQTTQNIWQEVAP